MVSIALLTIALSMFQWSSLVAAVRRLPLAECTLAALFALLSTLLTGFRWYVLVRRVVPGSLFWHLDHYFRANLFNAITPANLGGDAYRLVVLRGAIAKTEPAAVLILRERCIGLLSYCVTFLVALTATAIFEYATVLQNSHILVPVAMVAAAAVIALLAAPWLFGALSALELAGISRIASRIGTILLEVVKFDGATRFCAVIVLSLCAVYSWIITITIVADGVGVALWLPLAAIVGVTVELARWVPISVQGIGVRESLYAFLLATLAHVPTETGFVVGAMVYVILSTTTISLGCIFAVFAATRNLVSPGDRDSAC